LREGQKMKMEFAIRFVLFIFLSFLLILVTKKKQGVSKLIDRVFTFTLLIGCVLVAFFIDISTVHNVLVLLGALFILIGYVGREQLL